MNRMTTGWLADAPAGSDAADVGVGVDRAGVDRAGVDRAGVDRTGVDRTGSSRAGANRAERDRAGEAPADELRRLRGLVAQMGGLAEQAVAEAMTALSRGDAELAGSIRLADRRIDAMAAEVERAVIRILGRRAADATGLREAIAALKIAAMIERIADYAKNIAKRVPLIAGGEPHGFLRGRLDAFPAMGRMAGEMVRDALDAFAARDPAAAAEVCRRDRALDEVHAGVFRLLVAHMAENPATVAQGAHLLFVAKNLERIGDYATNLAEMVHFAATGEQMPERERGAAAG